MYWFIYNFVCLYIYRYHSCFIFLLGCTKFFLFLKFWSLEYFALYFCEMKQSRVHPFHLQAELGSAHVTAERTSWALNGSSISPAVDSSSETPKPPLCPITLSGISHPPVAPHHGGLWEAGVKSMKHHMSWVQQSSPTRRCPRQSLLASRPDV